MHPMQSAFGFPPVGAAQTLAIQRQRFRLLPGSRRGSFQKCPLERFRIEQ
jgi:hypothetical protein